MTLLVQHPRLVILACHLPIDDVARIVLEYEGKVSQNKIYPVDGVVRTGQFKSEEACVNATRRFRERLSPSFQTPFDDAVATVCERFPAPNSTLRYLPASYGFMALETNQQHDLVSSRVFDFPDLMPRTSGDFCGTPVVEKTGARHWTIFVESVVHPEAWFELRIRFNPQRRDYLVDSVCGRLCSTGFSRIQAKIDEGFVYVSDSLNPSCYASFQLPSHPLRVSANTSKRRKSKLQCAKLI